jgi:hypothetical protein
MENKETIEEAAENYASKKLQRPITIYSPLESNVAEYVGFIEGAKSDAAKVFWFSEFQKEVEDKTLHAMISIMQEYSIINEASVLQFHKEWIEQHKNK